MASPAEWSRRSVLAAGALGVTSIVGCADDAKQVGGTLSTSHWPAATPRWRMALPRQGRAEGLVVSLHGRGGDADSAFDLGLGDHVDQTRLAVVSVDGGDGYWHARKDGSDTGAMVREDLLPLALERAGLPARSEVVLHGWSMGGFGALLLASDLGPDRVKAVVAVSAALWTDGGQTPAGAYDDREDFERHSIFGRIDRLSRVPVRLDCGTSDPFIRANRVLAAKLPHVVAHFWPGDHDDGYWRDQLADELDWARAQ
jgi:esterase/lipase superfamily enzyme